MTHDLGTARQRQALDWTKHYDYAADRSDTSVTALAAAAQPLGSQPVTVLRVSQPSSAVGHVFHCLVSPQLPACTGSTAHSARCRARMNMLWLAQASGAQDGLPVSPGASEAAPDIISTTVPPLPSGPAARAAPLTRPGPSVGLTAHARCRPDRTATLDLKVSSGHGQRRRLGGRPLVSLEARRPSGQHETWTPPRATSLLPREGAGHALGTFPPKVCTQPPTTRAAAAFATISRIPCQRIMLSAVDCFGRRSLARIFQPCLYAVSAPLTPAALPATLTSFHRLPNGRFWILQAAAGPPWPEAPAGSDLPLRSGRRPTATRCGPPAPFSPPRATRPARLGSASPPRVARPCGSAS
jgi:hypothetical protein